MCALGIRKVATATAYCHVQKILLPSGSKNAKKPTKITQRNEISERAQNIYIPTEHK